MSWKYLCQYVGQEEAPAWGPCDAAARAQQVCGAELDLAVGIEELGGGWNESAEPVCDVVALTLDMGHPEVGAKGRHPLREVAAKNARKGARC